MVEYSSTSNYVITGVGAKALDLYDPPLTSETLSDETVSLVIQAKFNRRPDLLAHQMYGSARLWWVFAHYNRDTLVDPIMDFKSGTRIIAPRNFTVQGTN
jgi:hypothetical protein